MLCIHNLREGVATSKVVCEHENFYHTPYRHAFTELSKVTMQAQGINYNILQGTFFKNIHTELSLLVYVWYYCVETCYIAVLLKTNSHRNHVSEYIKSETVSGLYIITVEITMRARVCVWLNTTILCLKIWLPDNNLPRLKFQPVLYCAEYCPGKILYVYTGHPTRRCTQPPFKKAHQGG